MAKTPQATKAKPGNDTTVKTAPPIKTFDLSKITIHKERVKTGITWDWDKLKVGEGRTVPADLASSATALAHGYASKERAAGRKVRFQTAKDKKTGAVDIYRVS